MSNRELDDLFKNKLETLKRPPSPASWSKVEQGMGKKNKGNVWFYTKIAAAVLLLLTATVVIIEFNMEDHISPVALKNGAEVVKKDTINKYSDSDREPVKDHKDQTLEQASLALSTEKTKQTPSDLPTARLKKPASSRKREKTVNAVQNNTAVKKTNNVTDLPEMRDLPIEEPLAEVIKNTAPDKILSKTEQPDATKATSLASSPQEALKTTGRTLVFNIEEFNALAAAPTTTNEPSEDGKKGLKKVLDFVKSVKKGEGLAELREAKNDLFALNAKKQEENATK